MNEVRRPRRRLFGVVALGLVAAMVAAGCSKSGTSNPPTAQNQGGGQAATSLNGAGATFPKDFYEKVFADFDAKNGTQTNYQAIGSGGGIQQFTAKTVDFGATDAPMKDAELAKAKAAGGTVLHIPTVLGAVTVTYNLPGLQQALKMDGKLIGDIFVGKVRTWNDSEIAAQNSGVALPNLPIATVHRSDSSGTTANFTGYVAKQNPGFNARIGAGKEVKWVGGIGGKGNDGVTAAVKQTRGAVGYVELSYALQNHLPVVDVKNAAGRYVTPTPDSVTAAASDLSRIPGDFRGQLLNSPAPGAYPISIWTFLLVFQKQADAAKGRTLARLLWFVTHDGQASAKAIGFAPLPSTVVPRIEAEIRSITDSSGAALYTGA